jgi:hypothetical protein
VAPARAAARYASAYSPSMPSTAGSAIRTGCFPSSLGAKHSTATSLPPEAKCLTSGLGSPLALSPSAKAGAPSSARAARAAAARPLLLAARKAGAASSPTIASPANSRTPLTGSHGAASRTAIPSPARAVDAVRKTKVTKTARQAVKKPRRAAHSRKDPARTRGQSHRRDG